MSGLRGATNCELDWHALQNVRSTCCGALLDAMVLDSEKHHRLLAAAEQTLEA